ncbi:calcium-binding protein [Isoptericola variabilis]|uniref:Hemolysin-type calcium-binding region n=1 Tax=Isoptericola variabilis (strain 225) TaxID=743718 RepID=F6FV36_ISOV2|nr:calcium-binding protein [Isoptericola variabilis]AEG45464.1 Hemolysin-type calcium-binding region [Isoptericola variabilis 225]TWH33849.1 Ca2+-binding RTX toxin-like protein [Isoptericola variabilis J7]
MRAKRGSAVVGILTSGAVVATVLVAPPAVADEDDLFAEQVAAWARGLAEHETLQAPLPVVGVSPGDLLAGAVPSMAGDLDEVSDGRYRLAVTEDVATFLSLEPGFPLTSADDEVTVTVAAAVEFTVASEETDGGTVRYVVASGPDAPAVTASVDLVLPDDGPLAASVGLLGAQITSSDVELHAAYTGTVSDPDGNGRLAFDDPGGVPDDGELSAEGSAIGLSTVGVASAAASGTLAVTSTGAVISPPISASVAFDWPDLTDAATLTVTPTGFDAIGDYLNMSIRDTAEGLVLVKSALAALQRTSENADLPFMRGTVADAVVLSENLTTFLTGAIDPTSGQPQWTSVQELFSMLDAAPGIAVQVGGYDAANHRLPFTLRLEREQDGADPLYVPTPGLEGSDVKTGLVELGNLLSGDGGRKVANVKAPEPTPGDATTNPPATADRGYDVEVLLALDLQAPTLHDPPLQGTTPDGNPVYYDETPIGVDRMLFRSATATADFPITTPIAAGGQVGFVEVSVGGQIVVGPADGGQPMLSLTVGGTEYRPLGDLFEDLRTDAASAVDLDLNVAVSVTNGTITVPGLDDILAEPATFSVGPCDVATLPAGCTPTFGGSLVDLLRLDVDVSEPRALLGRLADILTLFDAGLRATSLMGDAAKAKLPVVGVSLADVLGSDGDALATSTKIGEVVDSFVLDPPTTLQAAVARVETTLGTDLPVRVGTVDGEPALVLDVDFHRAYERSVPLSYRLGDVPLVSAGADAEVTLDAAVDVDAGVAVPLGGAYGDWTASVEALRLVDPSVTASASAALTGTFDVSVAGLQASLGADGDPVTGAVGLTGTFGASGETTLGDLFGGSVQVTGTAECTGNALLCLDAPVYVLGAPISATDASLVITQPVPAGGTLSAAGFAGDTQVDLPSTDALADLLYGSALDLTNLPSALLTYLRLVEQGLQAASFGGKVPLVGQQLVEAANVIAEARAELEALGTQAGDEYTQVKQKLEDELGVTIEEKCGVLEPTQNVQVEAQGVPDGATTVTYAYVVVGRTAGGDITLRSAQDTAQNVAPLADGAQNVVTWDADPRAAGYLVLRQVDGGAWEQVADVTGTTFTDDGTATPTAAPAEATEKPLADCAGNPLAVETVVLTWAYDPGNDDDPNGPELVHNVPLDLGIPGLSLRASSAPGSGGIEASLDYGFRIKVALDKTAGVVILTENEDDKAEAYVEAGGRIVDQAGSDLQAELAVLQVDVDKNDADAVEVGGAFSVDFVGQEMEVGGTTTEALPLDALVTSPGDAITLHAEFGVDIDWNLTAAPAIAGQTLPGIATDFCLRWAVGRTVDSCADASPGDNTADAAQPAFGDATSTAPGAPSIAFTNISLDLGSFVESQLGPAIDSVNKAIDPLRPVIETLYAPIPVLTDLSKAAGGGEVTLVSLAETFNTLAGGVDTTAVKAVLQAIETAKTVTEISEQLASGGSVPLPIGDLVVNGSVAKTTPATPEKAGSLKSAFGPATPTGEAATIKGKLTGSAVRTPGKDGGPFGFTFTFLEQPEQLANLLLGGDVEIVRFDSGTLQLGFSMKYSIGPVYAPPPVLVTLSGAAGVKARVVVGFDTYGIRQAINAWREGGSTDVLEVLDGLYFATTDLEGKPVAVLEFYGEIAAGVAVSIVVITVEVRGGFGLTVSFYWNDPNDDGKFRFTEFADALQHNPICLFRVGGKLYLFLELGITLGVSIFSVSFDVTIAKVTLLDFSAAPDCSPEPPELATKTGDVLVVHLGRAGGDGQRGGSWGAEGDEPEVFKVYENHDYSAGTKPAGGWPITGYTVEGLGITTFYEGAVTKVVVDGAGRTTPFHLTFLGDSQKPQPGETEAAEAAVTAADADATVASFRTTVVVRGTEAADEIRTDEGPAWVDARGGDDVVTTANAAGNEVRVAGGAGKDRIGTGQGRAVVAGDSGLPEGATTTAKGATVATALGDPAESAEGDTSGGADVVSVGLGGNVVWGNGGDDVIGVVGEQGNVRGGATNILVGGYGGDSLTTGPGDDVVFPGRHADVPLAAGAAVTVGGAPYTPGDTLTDAQREALADAAGDADAFAGDGRPSNLVDTGSGTDLVVGSQLVDVVSSRSLGSAGQHAYLFGGAGEDVLAGGFGADEVFGGPDDDYVLAEPYTVGDVTGSDAFGPQRSLTRQPMPAGETPQRDLLVGGAHRDHVVGGDGGADAWGDAYRPAELCVPGDPVASDSDMPNADEPGAPNAADGRDSITGGLGVDVVRAGGGADRATLFESDDRACGQSGADRLDGGAGADGLWGGSDADVLNGDAGTDALYGNAGLDTIYGGPDDDVAEGNADVDTVFGGADDDMLVGGTRAAGRPDTGDRVYGDAGADVVAGDNATIMPSSGAAPGAPVLAGRPTADRHVVEHETGASPPPGTSGADQLFGGADDDALLGQGGDDQLGGGDGDDLAVGGRGSDTIDGDAGRDDLVGGSVTPLGTGTPGGPGADGQPDAGDVVRGGAGGDVALGDNAVVTVAAAGSESPLLTGRERATSAPRTLRLLDLGANAGSDDAGGDLLSGQGGEDVLFGQAGDDRVQGGDADDAAEGGPGTDRLEGGPGDDDLVGGSTTPAADPASTEPGTGSGASTGQGDGGDQVFGDSGDDAVLGDDGVILRGEGAQTSMLERSSTDGTLVRQRAVEPYDLLAPSGGSDAIMGGDGVDVLWGQDAADAISGGPHDDYAEGNGAGDTIFGDAPVVVLDEDGDAAAVPGMTVPVPQASWPGSSAVEPETGPDGQDDLIGGSRRAGFRDGGDTIAGNGESDVVLGDDGTLLRDPVAQTVGGTETWSDRVEPHRYPESTSDPAYPDRLFAVRVHDPGRVPAGQDGTTRFCAEVAGRSTCEPAGAFGADVITGDDGDDRLWGQDGNDTMRGGAGNDDVLGELGDDTLFGDAGQDTLLGDRGGVVGQWIDTAAEGTFTVELRGVPRDSYTGLRPGTLDRRVDLFSDVEDLQWVDTASAPMPYPGELVGGADRIRGGDDRDVVFGGAGGDLANGDSGGDSVLGGSGSDVLWGGRGLPDGSPDRGANDEHLDLVFGGSSVEGTGEASVTGADILDWNPRGSATTPGTTCSTGTTPTGTPGTVVDPCAWFAMTDTHDADPANDQHHHGTDWIYGGWDRDVMQGNETANGPSDREDRLIDWNGAYNLYSHCNAAYGGYNDVRQHSPSMKSFLQGVVYAAGAGRAPADASTPGTSAYLELALVEPGQNQHGSGRAFPTTPGHFDKPAACPVP